MRLKNSRIAFSNGIGYPKFGHAVYLYAPTLLIVLIIEVIVWITRREDSARWLTIAIVISYIGAFILMREISPHRHFNNNDLYHMVQILAGYFIYRAARALPDRGASR